MPRTTLFLAALTALATGAKAAAITISFAPVTLTAGSSTPVNLDVTISSTDPLSDFNLTFLITKDPANPVPPTALPQFITPASYLTDPTLTNSSYVFKNNSFDYNTLNIVFGTASDPGTGFLSRFIGGDSSDDFSDVAITASNNLLARLQINAATIGSLANANGDKYLISLNLSASSFGNSDGPIPISSISVTPGAITVLPAGGQPVPEPAVIVHAASALLALAGWRLASRRAGAERSNV